MKKLSTTAVISSHTTKKSGYWFSDFLDNVNLSTTQYITKKIPNIKFKLLGQDTFGSYIIRKIGFFIDDQMICQATNKVERNELVNNWIKQNPELPFGKIFQNNKLHRELISKSENSRKYLITGDINAEIEEKFYSF